MHDRQIASTFTFRNLWTVLAFLAATPAFAADLDVAVAALPFPAVDLLLLGALVLLSVVLALRLYRRHHSVEPLADAPDLRWWKNP